MAMQETDLLMVERAGVLHKMTAAELLAELIDARGNRSSLDLRISTISNFASPNGGGVVIGQYYDNSFQGTAGVTLAGAANRIELAPYYTSTRLRIDQIGVAVSTQGAGVLGRVVIYGSDSDGWPNALLYEGDSDLDFGSTGYKSHTLDFTFDSGRQYWLGIRCSGIATIRAVNVSSAVNLGLSNSIASNYATLLRRTVTFANPAPDPWVFTNSDRISNVGPPSIRFRAAALS